MSNNNILKEQEKGVSLIVTFFILTIILAVVLSISMLLYNGIKIIRNVSNSVVAFYAADSGVEKLLYYDRKQIPTGALRGFCYINNICPNCTPGSNGAPGDCIEINCQDWSAVGNDCDSPICGDCKISFNSFFDGKSYKVTAETKTIMINGVFTTSTSIDSRGNYKDVSRKIRLQFTSD